MKLMIIDDEMNIRKGISQSIPWTDVGIECVRDYSSGEEALSCFIDYLPDIVISDIRMDGMNGLDFLRKAKEIKQDLKTVFISGYADFEYVVQAMKLGAVDYELKPLNNDKLMSIVSRIRRELMDHNKEQEVLHKIEIEKRSKKLFEILNTQGFQMNASMYLQNIYELNIKEKYLLVLIDIDYYQNLDEVKLKKYLDELKKQVELKTDLKLWEVHNGTCLMLVEVNASFLYSFNIQYKIKRCIEYANSHGVMGVSVCAGISTNTTVDKVIDVYHQMQHVIQDKFYSGPGSVYLLKEELEVGRPIQDTVKESLNQEFLLSFASMDISRIEKVLNEFQRIWSLSKSHTKVETKAYISNLMKEVMLQQLNEKSMAIIDIIQFNEKLKELDYLEDIVQFWKAWIENYYKSYLTRSVENYSKNIMKALKHIRKNYRNDISAESVSEYIGKSPNYFSSLFKKEVGMKFSEYVNVLRIKKAKELMENSDMLLNEIAEHIGYSNYIYFTQVFKKIEGITPSQSRKHYRER